MGVPDDRTCIMTHGPMGKCLQHDHTLEGYSTTHHWHSPRLSQPFLSKYWNKVKKYHHSLWPKTSYDGMDKMNKSELEKYKGYKRPEEITHLIYTRVISTRTHSLHSKKKKNSFTDIKGISRFLKIETSTKSRSKQTKSNSNRKTCQKDLENAAASPNRWKCPVRLSSLYDSIQL